MIKDILNCHVDTELWLYKELIKIFDSIYFFQSIYFVGNVGTWQKLAKKGVKEVVTVLVVTVMDVCFMSVTYTTTYFDRGPPFRQLQTAIFSHQSIVLIFRKQSAPMLQYNQFMALEVFNHNYYIIYHHMLNMAVGLVYILSKKLATRSIYITYMTDIQSLTL